MNKKSIYSLIIEYLEEHKNEDGISSIGMDFDLPSNNTGKLSFAPGAEDGIIIYHMGITGISDEDMSRVESAIIIASNGEEKDFVEAESIVQEICHNNKAIEFADDIQSLITSRTEELNIDAIYNFGVHLTVNATEIECVKVGMIILGAFVQEDTEKQILRLLGLSDEFTLYSVITMADWENGDNEIWNLAKCVHGWGKIHAIHYLEPTTEEIKHWLLTKGVSNYVMPAYLALKCFRKAEVSSLIEKEEITVEELESVLEIVDAMLEEGPVGDISEIDEPETVLVKVLNHASKHLPLSAKAANVINNISDWQERNCDDDNPDMEVLIDEILMDLETRKNIINEAKKGKYISLAESLGLIQK